MTFFVIGGFLLGCACGALVMSIVVMANDKEGR